ncbi:MAG: hypothetical protein AAGA66_15245 [Bacteroidota bacterium]
MPPAIAPPKNQPRNADAGENTATPLLTPQEEQVGKEENQPESFQEAMVPNTERAIPMKGNPNPFPTMVGNPGEFVPMVGNPGEFIPMKPSPEAPIMMAPSQEEARETGKETEGKSAKEFQENRKQLDKEQAKQNDPLKTFRGFPVISQIIEPIIDGPEGTNSGYYIKETWFKIKPGLGGRVKQLVNSQGEVVKIIESGIFGIKKQSGFEDLKTKNPTILQEVVIEGTFKPLDIKSVFAEKGTDFTVKKLDMSEGGNIIATRLSKSGRKMMQIAALAANASGIGAIIGLGTEVAVASTQENPSDPSAGSKLSAASTLIDLANKGAEAINPVDEQTKRFADRFLSVFGKAANLYQLVEILSSDTTRRELATQILFNELNNKIGQFSFQGREDHFQFSDSFSKKGIEEITGFLNLNIALIEERLIEVKNEINKRKSH